MRWRRVLAGLLVFVGCVATLAAVPLRWADQQVRSDSYAETIRPLVREPEVQAAMSDLVLDAVASSGRELPPRANALIENQVAAFMRTPAATELWETANLSARDAIVDGTDNRITVDVADLAERLREPLRDQGVPVPRELPSRSMRIVLAESPAVGQARETIDLVSTLAGVLPVLAVGLLGLALVVSPRRGGTLAAAGFGVGVPTLAFVLVLTLAEGAAVASVGNEQTRPFVLALYQAFAGSLRADLLWLLLGSALAAVGGIVLALVTRRRPRQPDSW